jgi:antitoxin (DNA-binding transcriptional repressor) of toxin-antitoxin stability system
MTKWPFFNKGLGYIMSSGEDMDVERIVSKSQFKPKSLEYFRMIEESGEALIITDRGRPVLKIIPYTTAATNPEDRLKALRNSILKYEDPLEPVALEDWEVLK